MDQAVGARVPLDVACEILRQGGAPIGARALLVETLQKVGMDPEDAGLLAELQTEISLDNRFQPAPRGAWSLREWVPKPKPGRAGKASAVYKAKAPVEDEDSSEAPEHSEDWD